MVQLVDDAIGGLIVRLVETIRAQPIVQLWSTNCTTTNCTIGRRHNWWTTCLYNCLNQLYNWSTTRFLYLRGPRPNPFIKPQVKEPVNRVSLWEPIDGKKMHFHSALISLKCNSIITNRLCFVDISTVLFHVSISIFAYLQHKKS